MPVLRNPQFYFREGFCWNNVHTIFIKSRLKAKGVYDVASMSLFSLFEKTPNWFIVMLLNSNLISYYEYTFINQSVNLQINDIRQIPIVIPTNQQLADFKIVFDEAITIRKQQFTAEISKDTAKTKLEKIQQKLDQLVYKLYGFTANEVKIIESK